MPHAGGVAADLGRASPQAAFHSAASLLEQMVYTLLCYPVNTWFSKGKLSVKLGELSYGYKSVTQQD